MAEYLKDGEEYEVITPEKLKELEGFITNPNSSIAYIGKGKLKVGNFCAVERYGFDNVALICSFDDLDEVKETLDEQIKRFSLKDESKNKVKFGSFGSGGASADEEHNRNEGREIPRYDFERDGR